ncbi:2-hydroxy-palmitic acid dioxygenase Mpo1p [[Candida] railenensis]|uniref:2-hydroxy-palmitic acid dioxygenase Mpo1p n=1 Tax=[Candida] railenensis TaxID=45579 RepID=A0A9P0QLU3_9ASCO|nr:2-hydroxy-palmitic acid dioxygenase Mpo1p [[Candida] railenensis]
MGGVLDLEEHLVFYRSYHFNQTNVAIHLACIPVILVTAFAIFVPLQLSSISPYLNLGVGFALGYSIFYAVLDFKVGAITIPLLTSIAVFLTELYKRAGEGQLYVDQKQLYRIEVALHIAAWLAQFYGHAVHEKRAPALLDNLLQALVLAPFFVFFEVAFALGFRKDLEKTMNNKAGKLARDFKFATAEANRANKKEI